MKLKFIQGASLAALCGLLFSGCTVVGNAHYSGSGEMTSSGGLGKAYVEIDANTCEGNENAKGSFTYRDRNALDFSDAGGVALVGTVKRAGMCTSLLDGGDSEISECGCVGWPAVIGEYTSTNPQLPGSGRYVACFYNSTQEAVEPVAYYRATLVRQISFKDGPYAGHGNTGTLRGNIKGELCDVSASG